MVVIRPSLTKSISTRYARAFSDERIARLLNWVKAAEKVPILGMKQNSYQYRLDASLDGQCEKELFIICDEICKLEYVFLEYN